MSGGFPSAPSVRIFRPSRESVYHSVAFGEKLFERTYTTADDARVDNVAIELGFRGSSGTFRVDDVRVEAVD